MKAVALLLGLLTLGLARGQSDGLYWVSATASGQPLPSVHGGPVFLAERFNEKIDRVTLWNPYPGGDGRFILNLQELPPHFAKKSFRQVALVLDGRVMPFNGYSWSKKEKNITGSFSDQVFLKRVEARFHVVPRDQKHADPYSHQV